MFAQAQLLTAKPVLYVCNVDEGDAANGNALSARVFDKAKAEGAEAVVVSAAIEAEIATMPRRGPRRVPGRAGAGGDRPRPRHPRRLQAAPPAHLLHRRPEGSARLDRRTPAPTRRRRRARSTPISRSGFIRAETIAYDDYVALGGEARRARGGQAARRGQGLCRPRRRRDALPASTCDVVVVPVDLICLDADDTLWHNMRFFNAAQEAFGDIVAPFVGRRVARETLEAVRGA